MMTYLDDVPDFSKLNKILLIKLRHLGDVVLMTPLIAILHARYPQLQIDVAINEEGRDLLEGIAGVHQVIGYKRAPKNAGFFTKMKAEGELFQIVRKGGYDAVINLTEGDKGNLLAFFSRAPIRVGKEGSRYAKRLTHLYKKTGLIRHMVEREVDVLRRLGIYPSESEKKLLIARSPKEQQWVNAWLEKQGVSQFYVIHSVSRWLYKSPSAAIFKAIIEGLELPCILTGHLEGNEGRYLEAILQTCPKAIYFPSEGRMTRLIELIEASSGIITVDSLPLHIASSLKKPTVALFGPTSELDWGPWQNTHARVISYKGACRACYKDGCGGGKVSDCLEKIDPNEVIQVFRSLVSKEL